MFDQEIQKFYDTSEYPALDALYKQWKKSEVFQGVRILDASPVFRNTLVKYRALLAGGASLYVGVSDDFPDDPNIIELLKSRRIPVVCPKEAPDDFDLVLDCAGRFSHLNPRYGFVELTRSGVPLYENSKKPVWVADSGLIKQIETSLGTGDGFFRAMKQICYSDLENKHLVVVGCGKVGSGIILEAFCYGARVSVVTDTRFKVPENILPGLETLADIRETKTVLEIFKKADVIVTATGIKNALHIPEISEVLLNSPVVLANMGVEDEFGPLIPASRVLNEKKSLNFVLEEPTHLKYIDATMALHNALGEHLLKSSGAPGIYAPPKILENELLKVTCENGLITDQIKKLFGERFTAF